MNDDSKSSKVDLGAQDTKSSGKKAEAGSRLEVLDRIADKFQSGAMTSLLSLGLLLWFVVGGLIFLALTIASFIIFAFSLVLRAFFDLDASVPAKRFGKIVAGWGNGFGHIREGFREVPAEFRDSLYRRPTWLGRIATALISFLGLYAVGAAYYQVDILQPTRAQLIFLEAYALFVVVVFLWLILSEFHPKRDFNVEKVKLAEDYQRYKEIIDQKMARADDILNAHETLHTNAEELYIQINSSYSKVLEVQEALNKANQTLQETVKMTASRAKTKNEAS